MALLGIDLGTSAVKALLVSAEGEVLGRGAAGYVIERPKAGWAEQSPEEWWRATAAAVQVALAEGGGRPEMISAIGLSGQMHGTVLLDQAGSLLCPAVIWPDQRSRQQVMEITRTVGAHHLLQISGSPLATGFQAATLRWFQRARPDVWRKVRRVLTPKDYLRWRLTGETLSEPSDGSGTLLMDVRQRDWSPELLATIDVGEHLLPEIRPSTAIGGRLSREAAEDLGLPTGIPVVNGAADTACGLLGAGCVDEGTLLLTVGSGGQLVVPSPTVQVDLDGRLHTFCAALEPAEGQPGWYMMAAILAAGLSLRWLRDQILSLTSDDAYDTMTGLAQQSPAGANGLLFLPYLLGERTPHMDPRARGMFLGLTAEHGRPALVRAVMEGVVLACYDAFDVLVESGARPKEIIMAGGGAKSSLWRQIVADVFKLPVRAVATSEQAAMGAALLAGVGLEHFEPVRVAKQWANYEPPIEPQARAMEVYGRLLAIYRAAYQKHKSDFVELGGIENG